MKIDYTLNDICINIAYPPNSDERNEFLAEYSNKFLCRRERKNKIDLYHPNVIARGRI